MRVFSRSSASFSLPVTMKSTSAMRFARNGVANRPSPAVPRYERTRVRRSAALPT